MPRKGKNVQTNKKTHFFRGKLIALSNPCLVRKKEKKHSAAITSERMRAWESRGTSPPGRSRAAPLRGVGQRPTSEAKPNERDALGFATGMGEYRWAARPNLPDCDLGQGWFCPLSCASLMGRCPIPRWWRCPQAPAREPVPWTPRSHSLASCASLFLLFLFCLFLLR